MGWVLERAERATAKAATLALQDLLEAVRHGSQPRDPRLQVERPGDCPFASLAPCCLLYAAQAPGAAGRAALPGAALAPRRWRVEVNANASGQRVAVTVRTLECVVLFREPGSPQVIRHRCEQGPQDALFVRIPVVVRCFLGWTAVQATIFELAFGVTYFFRRELFHLAAQGFRWQAVRRTCLARAQHQQ
eukprot:9528755-Alexandrium_andersonii.AAC.1